MSKEKNSEVGPQDASASDAPAKDPNADIYENRGSKKIIRVVTVMAYLFSVSFVGILLSAYYIFLWEPPNPTFIERSRLRADPQVEFLIGEPYLEEADHLKKKENLVLENVPNRRYKSKSFLGRIAHDAPDGLLVNPDEASQGFAMSRQGRLNVMLLKLKHSLTESLRETRRNRTSRLSHGTTSKESNNYSFFEAKDPLSSTSKPATSFNIKPKQTRRFGERPVERDVTPIVGGEAQHSEEETHVVAPYTVPVNESSDSRSEHDAATRRDSNRPDRNEVTKRERNSADRRVIDNEDPNDALEIATPKKYPDRRTSRPLSVNNSVNCFGSNECCTSCQTERIARDKVSIDSSDGSRFANDPRLHQLPDDPAVKPTYAAKFQRNSEETQIEKMTARSTTIDNKQLEELDLSTTQQERGLWEILTESTNAENTETFVEFTSMSTVQDYRNNFTSTMNDSDENVT